MTTTHFQPGDHVAVAGHKHITIARVVYHGSCGYGGCHYGADCVNVLPDGAHLSVNMPAGTLRLVTSDVAALSLTPIEAA